MPLLLFFNIVVLKNDSIIEGEDVFILTEEEIQNIYPDVMLYSGEFPSYKKTGLINYLDGVLDFSDNTEAWLNSNAQDFSYSVLIYDHLRDNEFSESTSNGNLTFLNSIPGSDHGAFERLMDLYDSQNAEEKEQGYNIYDFLVQHHLPTSDLTEQNLSLAIGIAYADIYQDIGLTILELGDDDGNNNPLVDIAKDMLMETVKELLADLIPGGTLVTIGPELFANLQSGDWMDAMYNAFDIVLNEADVLLPAAKVASLALGMYTTGKHLKKAYDAFKKAKSLGEDFLLKLYNVFRNKLNWTVTKVRDKFQWLGGVNMKVDDISGNEFFEKLKEEFNATNVFPGKNGEPVFKILDVPVNQALYMELYPDANSGWSWTIEISRGANNASNYTQITSQYKFRFDF